MTRPRQILPDSFYMITRRATQRLFLLRPDDVTNQTLVYCLADAVERSGIQVILPSMMSNHHHTIVYDPDRGVVDFMEHFHKMAARALNVHWHRSENLWSSDAPSLVRLEPDEVMDKLVYAATNPVKDGLVESVHHWPGVNGLRYLLNDRPMTAKRPRQFFRTDGDMPEEVSLRLAIPRQLGDAETVRSTLRARVDAEVARLRQERSRTSRRVIGRKQIKKQSWTDSPPTEAPRRGLRPRFAAKSRWARAEAARRDRAFLDAYAAARAVWIQGGPAVFPSGTYWLQRFAGVQVAPPAVARPP